MVGWYQQLNELEVQQTQGGSEGQGSLVCYSPRGYKELDMKDVTGRQNNNKTGQTEREQELGTE